MVTINPARHFGFQRLGAIVPGFRADLVVLNDLEQFKVRMVYSHGQCVAENEAMLTAIPEQSLDKLDPAIRSSVRINPESIDLTIPAAPGLIRVICCTDGQIVTSQSFMEPKIQDGLLISDVDRDILKIVVIERHHGSHAIGFGFVQGLGLKKGAIGSTVAHDSHNLVVVGTSDAAMMQAITEITKMQGGLAVTGEDQVYAALPLPVAGLMSTATAEKVRIRLRGIRRALDRVGTAVENPIMLLSFLALPVIPELKITDKGLVNVCKFSIVPLQNPEKNNKK